MKTIKQIADELGLDKQRVYRYIKQNHIKNCISEAHQKSGVMYYDNTVETRIKSHFLNFDYITDVHHEVHQTASNDAVADTVILMLQRELEIKNEQIRELNARLAETTSALLAAQQTTQAAQVLHATEKKQLPSIGGELLAADASLPKSFLQRIFGK